MKNQLIQLQILFFFLSVCLADNDFKQLSNRQRFLQYYENKQVQGQIDCPQDQCIQFDTNLSRCIQCAKSQDSHESEQNEQRINHNSKQKNKTVSLIIAIVNLLILAILQYTWINISQKNKTRFINSTQVLNKKLNNPQGIVHTENYPIQLITGIPIQTAPDNSDQPKNNKSIQDCNQEEQKVECQQIRFQQARFSLQAESISLSPDLLLSQGIQKNQQQLQTFQQQIFNNQQIIQLGQQDLQQNRLEQQSNGLIQNCQQNLFKKCKYSGYQLTQAGNYSFESFSNQLRIRHVIINIVILQLIFSKILVFLKKDNSSSVIDDYLVIEFLIGMIIYWLSTFFLPVLFKILPIILCIKSISSCRCSQIFIALLFEIISITLGIFLTLDLIKMSTAMIQIWILLWSQGLFLIIIFDIKSVKSLKNQQNSLMAKCVMFRKMNFNVQKSQES
ncbi:hypothetical protein ABPG74_017649 [Tetrahymena malaccensis]